MAEVVVPNIPIPSLVVFKLFTSVQEVPFHISVSLFLEGVTNPPAIIAFDALLPTPMVALAVLASATSVQEDPFQVSVLAITAGLAPGIVLYPAPKTAEVVVPPPPFPDAANLNRFLQSKKSHPIFPYNLLM